MPRAADDYDLLMKLVLLGDSGVGKSNLLLRFSQNTFHTSSKPTIGVEFATSNLSMPDGTLVKAQIWDTAGQERYRAITSAYYRGAVGALVIYDVTSQRSFQAVDRWMKDLRMHATGDLVILLVGNKIDLGDQREVTADEAKALAEREDMLYMETSALSGANVREAFERVVHEVYSSRITRQLQDVGAGSDQDSPEVAQALKLGRRIVVEEVMQPCEGQGQSKGKGAVVGKS